jgi:hypothetical protein
LILEVRCGIWDVRYEIRDKKPEAAYRRRETGLWMIFRILTQ